MGGGCAAEDRLHTLPTRNDRNERALTANHGQVGAGEAAAHGPGPKGTRPTQNTGSRTRSAPGAATSTASGGHRRGARGCRWGSRAGSERRRSLSGRRAAVRPKRHAQLVAGVPPARLGTGAVHERAHAAVRPSIGSGTT